MDQQLWQWGLLIFAAFLAGVVNSVAGGGTLLTFPSLLAVVNPIAANATSTVALMPGTLFSGLGYRDELRRSKRHLIRLLPPSLLGGLIGSLLVTRMSAAVFATAVPWLLIVASVLLILQGPLVRRFGTATHQEPTQRTVMAIVFFQFLVGIYGGYFGAGIGILMLSSLGFMGIESIHEMNAVKSILAAAMNGVTIVVFVLSGVIVWKYALVMAVAGGCGGYAGARVARKLRPVWIRGIVVAVGVGVAAYSWMHRG